MSAWSKFLSRFRAIAGFVIVAALAGAASPLAAQQPQSQPQPLSDPQVQQLVAPVALYPDSLLAQILTASTYPLEVVMAARWSKDNPDLKGADLENAMQQQTWDPAVKGLTAVPQVLAMMSDKLDWTQQLGEAFLAQPDDITKAVQILRARADASGNLQTTEQQRILKKPPPPGYAGEAPQVVYYIEPVEPEVYYVPVYDPVVIFGVGYWSTVYVAPPFFWYPTWWTVGPVWGFGPAFFVGPAVWCSYHWYAGGVHVNGVLYSKFNKVQFAGGNQFQKWQHDPLHRVGAPYKNVSLQQKFGNQALRSNQTPKFNITDRQGSLGTGHKNTLSTGGNTQGKLHNTVTTGNKYNDTGNKVTNHGNTGNQIRSNQIRPNQSKFTNTQNLSNRNIQPINRGPTSGGNRGPSGGNQSHDKHF